MKRLQLFGNPKVPIWLQGPMDWYESVGVELAVTWGQIPQWVWEVRNMRYFRAQTIWLEGTQDDIRDRRRAVLGMARGIISPRDAADLEIDSLYPIIPIDSISPHLANLICVAYKDEVMRTFCKDTDGVENDDVNKGFDDLYEELNINEVMDQAYRAALFTNTVLILWSAEDNKFLVLTPEYFRVEDNGVWVARRTGTPGIAKYSQPTGEVTANNSAIGEIVYDVWSSNGAHEVRSSGGKIMVAESGDNPYDMFPGVLLKLTPSNDVYGAGVTEAADINAASNLIGLFERRIALYYGFPIAVGTNIKDDSGGSSAKNNLRTGPGRLLRLQDPDGTAHPDFKFVSPDAPFDKIQAFRQSMIKSFERNQDLPAYLVDENLTPPSGVALTVMEQPLKRKRESHFAGLRRAEKTLARFVLKLAEKRGQKTLELDNFEINYADAIEFRDPADEVVYDDLRISRGYTTPSEIARKYLGVRRGITDAEALELLQKNKAAFGPLVAAPAEISLKAD